MSHGDKPATPKQQDLIKQLLEDYPESKHMFEYEDYIRESNRENASELISSIMDQNITDVASKENYIGYIANRPRVERLGEHGLFSDTEAVIDLDEAAQAVGEHEGSVWTHIISLKREDAQRLGYDHAASWVNLCRAKRNELAEAMRIDPDDLVWYGAFHNEGHHPHIHMVAYSKDPRKGFVTRDGIEKIRSMFASEIFHQDLMQIYKEQTEVRDALKQYSRELVEQSLQKLQDMDYMENHAISEKILALKSILKEYHGRPMYAYLPQPAKQLINEIIAEMEQEEHIQTLYEQWLLYREDIYKTYHDQRCETLPLREQKEFKSIKNMILQEVLRYDAEVPGYDEQLKEMNESSQFEDFSEGIIQQSDNFCEEVSSNIQEYQLRWSKTYRQAAAYFYGSKDVVQDLDLAKQLLEEECKQKNVLAFELLAKLHEMQGSEYTEVNEWYRKALKGFLEILEKDDQEFVQSYLHYKAGKSYFYGKGTEQNYEDAFRHFIESENMYANYSLGTMYQRGLYVEQSDAMAFDYYEKSAKEGNAFACYQLGYFYEQGIAVMKDADKAQENYQTAYRKFEQMIQKQEDDNLLYRLGEMTYHGKGVESDTEKAVVYLEKAAAFDNKNAKYLLARIYLQQYAYANIPQALTWLEESENPQANYILGMVYQKGLVAEQNIDKAIHYLEQSAKQHNSYAMYQLSKIYREDTLYLNPQKAMAYLQQAASSGNESAQVSLGNELLKGEIIEKDVEKAIWHLTQAADKNNMFAQYILGKLFLFGKDITQDKEKAKGYLEQSASQGNTYAAYLLEHMDDYQSQPIAFMTTRFFHHVSRIFSSNMPCEPSLLKGVDKKLAHKIRMKKIAQGHNPNDHEINIR